MHAFNGKFRMTAIYKVLLLAATLMLNICEISAQCSPTTPCSPLKGSTTLDLSFPQQVKSSNGYLDISLVVDIADFQVDWLEVQRRLYNKSFPGPTLRIKAGDQVSLLLINELDDPDFTNSSINTFRYPNTTNLHTHGLHISSKEPQDDVLTVTIPPKSSYQYIYQIHGQQPAGSYFYHPHIHGSVFLQNSGGMAGLIVVEDDPSTLSTELNSASCPKHCENEVELVLQQFQYSSEPEDGNYADLQRNIHDYEGFRFNNVDLNDTSGTLEEWLEDPDNNIKYFLVNGQLNPTLNIDANVMKRFRIVNAGPLNALALQIINEQNENDACLVREIAIDGLYLDEPRKQRFNRTLLVSAGRAEWLVICPKPGLYTLRSIFYASDQRSMGDHPSFTGSILKLNVTQGASTETPYFPLSLPERPSFVNDFRLVKEDNLGGRIAVEVTATDTLNREDFRGKYYRFKARVNTVQELYFTNTEYETSHPIHIHLNSFQVISYNPYTGPYAVSNDDGHWALFSQSEAVCPYQYDGYVNDSNTLEMPESPLQYLGHDERYLSHEDNIGYSQVGEFRDVLLIPPLGNITVRFETHEFADDVVIHCHLLGDEDQGMMMLIQIVPEGESLEANVTSGGVYPWACTENLPLREINKGNGASSIHQSLFLASWISLISSISMFKWY